MALNKFGSLLRLMRRSRHLTQSDLARKAHLSQSHISALESGNRLPKRELVHSLAEALRLDSATSSQLYASAGFVAPRGASADDAAVLTGIDHIVGQLLLFSDNTDVIVQDVLDRIHNWVIYQQATVAAMSEPHLARYLCRLIASRERKSTLIANVSALYADLPNEGRVATSRQANADEA